MRRRLSLVLVVIAILGLLLFLFWYNNTRSERPQIGDRISIDQILTEADRPDLKAQFFLVKFWGSWCAPCRADHPAWIAVYNKYHSQSSDLPALAVVGVALEGDSIAWRLALEKDQLPWEGHIVQGRDLEMGWAGELKVSSVPENILVDSGGLILGRNMTPGEVDRFLRHRLTE